MVNVDCMLKWVYEIVLDDFVVNNVLVLFYIIEGEDE